MLPTKNENSWKLKILKENLLTTDSDRNFVSVIKFCTESEILHQISLFCFETYIIIIIHILFPVYVTMFNSLRNRMNLSVLCKSK